MSGCNNHDNNVVGKVYTYEKDGMGGDFNIYIYEDGTFTYYEGMLSSYIGIGTWTVKGSRITLTDDDEMGFAYVNHFEIVGDNLSFIEKDSDNFLYVKVKDGEVFKGISFYSEEPQITTTIMEK